jgi:anti-sigma factor RsiW
MSAARMTCRDMVQFLMDYLSEELPDDTRKVFELHVNACPDCVTYLATYRETIVLCRESFAVREQDVSPEVPEDLIQAILAAQKKIAGSA